MSERAAPARRVGLIACVALILGANAARAEPAAPAAGPAAPAAGPAVESAALAGGPEFEPAFEPKGDPDTEPRATRGVHVNVAAGGFVAFTGPAGHGPAAELELYPGGALGRWGAGVYWRGFEGFGRGMVAAGASFEAGAARPMFALAVHGEMGWDYADSLPVVGGGVRAQLAVWHPLALAANVTGHLFVDGVDSRLALAVSVTVGLTR